MTIRNMMKALLKGPDAASEPDACVFLRDGEDFEAAVKSHDRLMVLFYASWCPFSQAFLGTFRKRAASASGDPCYARIVVDDGDPVSEKYAIEVFPTVLFFEKGKPAKRLDGVHHRGLSQGRLEEFARRCAVKKPV